MCVVLLLDKVWIQIRWIPFYPKNLTDSLIDFGQIGINFVARYDSIFSDTDKSENNNKD